MARLFPCTCTYTLYLYVGSLFSLRGPGVLPSDASPSLPPSLPPSPNIISSSFVVVEDARWGPDC